MGRPISNQPVDNFLGTIPSLPTRSFTLDSIVAPDPQFGAAGDSFDFLAIDDKDSGKMVPDYSFFSSNLDPTYDLPSTLNPQRWVATGRK